MCNQTKQGISDPSTNHSAIHFPYRLRYQCVNQTVVPVCEPNSILTGVFLLSFYGNLHCFFLFCLCLDPCTVCGSGIHIWLMQCLRGFAPEYASSRPLPLSYRFKIFTRKKNCECCSECNAELEHPNTTELEGKKICKLLVLLRCRLIGSTSNVLPKFLVSIHQESTS